MCSLKKNIFERKNKKKVEGRGLKVEGFYDFFNKKNLIVNCQLSIIN